MLNHNVFNDDNLINGFSRKIYRSDHSRNLRIGGVRSYYRDELSIKRIKNLEFLSEIVCADITVVARKNFSFLLSIVVLPKISMNLKELKG